MTAWLRINEGSVIKPGLNPIFSGSRQID